MAYVNPLAKAMKMVQLRPVKKIAFMFDPYGRKVRSIRDCMFLLQSKSICETNLTCQFSVNVKSDNSEPLMDVHFSDGEKLQFKTENLQTIEILERLVRFCSVKDPKKDDSSTDLFTSR